MRDRLAIFDLDGTLVDTVRANYEAYRFVAEKSDMEWNTTIEEFKKIYFGKSYRFFLPKISNASIEECERMHLEKEHVYDLFLEQHGRTNESVAIIAKCLYDSFYLSLVTTASRNNTKKVIDRFIPDIDFDLVITGEDVRKIKPDTEAYNKAMIYFGIPPERTVVFDDIEHYANVAAEIGTTAFHIL